MKLIKKWMKIGVFFIWYINMFTGFMSYGAESEEIEEPNNLYATAAILMDGESGRILFEKNGSDVMPMASTTKIMTCILALELGDLESEVVTSSYAASMPKVHLGMKSDDTFLLKDLLYSLMLESHNDSAVAIAEHIGGSVEGFTQLMNDKAKEIGCMDTCYVTPNGLDGTVAVVENGVEILQSHATTATDLARVMRYCTMQSPMKEMFLEITQTPSYSFEANGRIISCTNHNAYLNMEATAISGKTGFTNAAGYCYVGAVHNGEESYIVSLLACGWPNHSTYKWSDMKKLIAYGYDFFEKRDFSEVEVKEEQLTDILVENGQSSILWRMPSVALAIESDQEIYEPVTVRADEKLSVDWKQEYELVAPVEKGQEVGSISYYREDELLYTFPIVTTGEVKAIDYKWCFMEIIKRMLV